MLKICGQILQLKARQQSFVPSPTASFHENEPLHVLEHCLSWSAYAEMVVESRALGNTKRRQDMAFLAFAFRDFDLDKNNVLDADEFRKALSSFYISQDVLEECFDAMAVNDKGNIQLDEFLDHLPQETIRKLHHHSR